MSGNDSRHPRGYWIGIGISLGVAIGAALGMALENTGAGIGVGIALGVGIGASLEQRNKDNLRPLTEEETQRQKRSITVGLAAVAILAVLLVIDYFLQAR